MTKPRLLLCAMALVASAGYGQWLESTIPLPDTFGGPAYPCCLQYDSVGNKIYVGGEYGNRVVVVDGSTNRKSAWIPVGDAVEAMCLNTQCGKLYCAEAGDGRTIRV